MSEEIFDRKTALEQMGGDEELMVELVEVFLEDLPERLQEIEAALAAGDAETLSRAAHTLKGSVGNFAAHAAYETAFELETLAKQGTEGADQVYAKLGAQIELLKKALGELQ